MSVQDQLLIAHRRECEDRRRYVADLENLAERLGADAERLRAEIRLAEANGAATTARQLIERQAKLARSLDEIGEQLAGARVALATAEQQLRSHELVPRGGALAARRTSRRRR